MITLREVEDRDLIPLSEFLPGGFHSTTKKFWLQLFDFWWIKNPAWTPRIPRGWVLDDGANLVGFIGNIPVTFLIHGKPRIAAASNSWYVDPSIRGIYSFRLLNEFMKQRHASLFLFKSNYENLAKILFKYHFKEYILPRNQKEYVYIINKSTIKFNFIKFIFNDKIPKFDTVPELCGRLGSLLFSCVFQKPLVNKKDLPGDEYKTSLSTSCDDAFLTISNPNLRHCDATISRDLATLNWLYFSSSRFNKRMVIQCRRSKDETLAGYLVFDILRDKHSRRGIMQLVDMCIEDNNPSVLKELTSFAIETGKLNKASLLVVWADSQEAETYFQNAFTLRRSVQNYRYVKVSDSPEMNAGKDNSLNVCLPLLYPPQ
jgi:hypothetical protein